MDSMMFYPLIEDRLVAPALLRARARAMEIAEREMNLWRSSYLVSYVAPAVLTPKTDLYVCGPASCGGFCSWRSGLSMPLAVVLVGQSPEFTFTLWCHELRHARQRLRGGANAWEDPIAIECDAEWFASEMAGKYGGQHAA